MLLATGQCLVFSPSALVMRSNDSSVRLLGGDYLKLRVRPRLTLEGGVSLLAVGRILPGIDCGAPIFDMPQTPAQQEMSYTARQVPLLTHALPISVVRDTENAEMIPSVVPHSEDSGTSSASVSAASTNAPRAAPAHLKYLIGWLQRNGGANRPLNLNDAMSKLFWIGKKVYGARKKWWNLMLEEAEAEGLVEVTNLNVKNKELKALRTIRLLHPGPFIWM